MFSSTFLQKKVLSDLPQKSFGIADRNAINVDVLEEKIDMIIVCSQRFE